MSCWQARAYERSRHAVALNAKNGQQIALIAHPGWPRA
jgi:hypothetical protein